MSDGKLIVARTEEVAGRIGFSFRFALLITVGLPLSLIVACTAIHHIGELWKTRISDRVGHSASLPKARETGPVRRCPTDETFQVPSGEPHQADSYTAGKSAMHGFVLASLQVLRYSQAALRSGVRRSLKICSQHIALSNQPEPTPNLQPQRTRRNRRERLKSTPIESESLNPTPIWDGYRRGRGCAIAKNAKSAKNRRNWNPGVESYKPL